MRRYTGLPWSGGGDETWAWRFFDAVPDSVPDALQPIDVLAATALGAGPSPADLVWFWQQQGEIDAFLQAVPAHAHLESAEERILARVRELPAILIPSTTVTLSLLTKVLHRKRPALIPLLDKAVLEQYRHLVPERGSGAAWPHLLDALRADLVLNRQPLAQVAAALTPRLPTPPSPLRIIDIIIWMASQSRRTR